MIDVHFQLPILFSSSYVCLRMLLLLSGDVELNPGPMIDDQPTGDLFAKYLEPLDDWEQFALCLPGGITQLDIDIIKTKGNSYLRMEALHKRWLQVNPTASWRDVINALKQSKENELARTIEDKVTNSGPITGNLKDILKTHCDKLAHATSANLCNVTDALYAKDLIPQQTKEDMHVMGIADNKKASNLVHVIENQLEASLNPEQYLINICHVLINQKHRALTDIATSILRQLGQPIPIQPTEPKPELPPAAAAVSEEVDAPAKVDVFNIDIKELIKRHASDNENRSGEIPIGGTTIKWKREKKFSGFELKWVCTCEDTQTGLKIKGPRKQSRDGALEHCLRELFDEFKKKQ
ncbi:PREDICTED: uncharacterized protein LOC109587182 [Amphimedon queenslandica]|uniref:Death domain-containing protein n=1 Tax=Amphimedon queenslandica TaxID=400682 RepID=A0AAN0JQ94_AMPQE|nr:PREDICTED: uncharacterized protein LOC109587182 [Amphimedon queenslandica]|eukprot:XP_019858978.1 PREDICTED: uncharacterized protein LOC109587182 [Amphimedon queenslandica]